jgi:hypothetical protein
MVHCGWSYHDEMYRVNVDIHMCISM